MTIPASQIVSAVGSVLSAGGTPVSQQGLLLTSGARVPIGEILQFPTSPSMDAYFGANSREAAAGAIYFSGFTGSNILPPSVLVASYPIAPVPAWLRAGSAVMTLAALQALTGVLSLTVNGSLITSSTIVLLTATSFSSAAALIEAAFTTPPFSVSYDSVAGAFVFTSTLTGAAATITAASGTLAAPLNLTAATGAVVSQGADVATPAAFMTALVLATDNWASFTTLFDPDAGDNTNKMAFATWNGQQANRFLYIPWDTDITPTQSTAAPASLGALVKAAGISGTMPLWGPDNTIAVFACGVGAAIDFTETNGRITYAFKGQSGLLPSVNDATTAANLLANHYNFYGSYALATNGWAFLTPGSISGQYAWADSYIDQIQMNSSFVLALMTLLTNTKSIPYNAPGYALVEAALMDPILAAVNFGSIAAGVPPSALQAAEMNQAAGVKIDNIVATRGWYLQVLPATAQTRGLRKSPPITFWYSDGGSIQQMNIASVEVQ